MSMTESEALGMLRAKLTCMELEDLACIEKGCDKDCDNCNYCYEQGNRGQSKEALSVAISALEEVQKIKELGDCYIIPKNSTWEVNGIDIHKALEEIQQYRAIGTVSEFRENKNFLEFLYNAINPNEMEQYLAMYHASGEKGE